MPRKLPSTNFSDSPTLSAMVVGTSPRNERCFFVAAVPESVLRCAAQAETHASNTKRIPAFIGPPKNISVYCRQLGRLVFALGSESVKKIRFVPSSVRGSQPVQLRSFFFLDNALFWEDGSRAHGR